MESGALISARRVVEISKLSSILPVKKSFYSISRSTQQAAVDRKVFWATDVNSEFIIHW